MNFEVNRLVRKAVLLADLIECRLGRSYTPVCERTISVGWAIIAV